ncbi:MAG: hypothetical protein MUC46_05720, partial [Desulfobacterales bacterium]|nr:hypothetical protein [Desulfobacterales bacterium]
MRTNGHVHLLAALRLLLVGFIISGCAIVPSPTRSARVGDGGELGSCAELFSSIDRSIARAGVIDAGAFRVEGYPYLRVNRFLASFGKEPLDPDAFNAWIGRMQALDREARRFELANFADASGGVDGQGAGRAGLDPLIAGCGDRLKAADFSTPEGRVALREALTVPDEYLVHWQILGLYPVTRLFVSAGVSRWHAGARGGFSNDPPVGGRGIRYVPETMPGSIPLSAAVRETPRDALGVPDYTESTLDLLFRAYAPVWEVETEGGFDRIGAPAWRADGRLSVDKDRPLVFTFLSFSRFEGEVLTQLNYTIWFPARPKAHVLDIYGGFLDGLTFRVTLDMEGNPLLYETVHNCGCYYAAYPTQRLKVRERIDLAEPPLIFSAPDAELFSDRLVVGVESRTHYVR